MAYRWFVADLLTGSNLVDLPAVDAGSSWASVLNGPETIRCEINMAAEAAREFNVRAYTMPGRVVVGVAEGPYVLAAGPLWRRRYSRDEQKVTLNAAGMWSYFDHRFIHALAAATASVRDFTSVVSSDPSRVRTAPNPDLAVDIAGVSVGTYAKRIVEVAMQHTGGNVPVVLPAEETGKWGRTIDALDFEVVGTELRNVTEMEDGVDIEFRPRFTAAGDGIEWVFRHGTKSAPLLAGGPFHWDFTAADPAASGFVVEDDADLLTSRAWATGGRSDDKALVSRRTEQRLLEVGFALFERLDASHGSTRQHILDRYAGEMLKVGYGPSESWTFDAERNRNPLPGLYAVGDWANLTLAPYDEESRRGDAFIREGGTFRRRIMTLRGEQGKDTIAVTTAPTKE